MESVGNENCKTFLKIKIGWEIKKLHNKYCYLKKQQSVKILSNLLIVPPIYCRHNDSL